MSRPSDEILFVTDRLFWRCSIGSEQRIASLLRFLCRNGFRVAALHVGRIDRGDRQRVDDFVASCPGLTVLDRSGPALISFLRGIGLRVREARGPLPPIPGRRSSATRRAFVHHAIRSRAPRVVVVEFLRLAHLVLPRPALRDGQPLYLIDTHDVMHERARLYRAEGMATGAGAIDAEEEARILETFDALIAIQARESAKLAELAPSRPVLLVPHGIPIPEITPPPSIRSPGGALRLGFLGGRDESNVRGLDWLLEEVWPSLESALGDAIELHVAGQVCARWRPPSARGLRIHGAVDSVDAFWTEVDIAVNPVRAGSGLKIKNVEALAHGRPLLTTSVGAQGLEEASPSGLRIADTPAAWIDALQDWARDAEGRHITAARGHDFAKLHFCEAAAFGPLVRYLEGV